MFSCEFCETLKSSVSSLVAAFRSQVLVWRKCLLNEPRGKKNIFYNQLFYGKSVSEYFTPVDKNDSVFLFDPFSYLTYIYFTVTRNEIECILFSSNVDESLPDVLKFGTTHA